MTAELITGIAIDHAHHPKRGQITRLSWHGWQVDLDGLSVSVPQQDSTGTTTTDLAILLQAAYRMLNIAVPRPPDLAAMVRGGLPKPMADDLVSTFRAAQHIADVHWHRRSFDIYACTSQAWHDSGMKLPYALLIATLRSALPQPGSSLADFNDTATASAIHTLYEHAITLCSTARPVSHGTTSRIA